jgi:hypothetical protein
MTKHYSPTRRETYRAAESKRKERTTNRRNARAAKLAAIKNEGNR